jgi:hypothetical protein
MANVRDILALMSDMDRVCFSAKLCGLSFYSTPSGQVRALGARSRADAPDMCYRFCHTTESVFVVEDSIDATETFESRATPPPPFGPVATFDQRIKMTFHEFMDVLSDGDEQTRLVRILRCMASFVRIENIFAYDVPSWVSIIECPERTLCITPTFDSVCALLHLALGCGGEYTVVDRVSRRLGAAWSAIAMTDAIVVFNASSSTEMNKCIVYFGDCKLNVRTLAFENYASFDQVFFHLYFQIIRKFPPPGMRCPPTASLMDRVSLWLRFQSDRRPPGTPP